MSALQAGATPPIRPSPSPIILPRLSSILLVARNECSDSLRSRRVWVLFLLYLAGSAAATFLFLHALHRIEAQVEASMGLGAPQGTGGVTQALWASPAFRRMVIRLVGDRALAETLLDIPPLGLFYGWLSLTLTPLLVVLTSSVRIAEEVWSGSVRFVLFRASRLSWCAGKFLGQSVQLLGALLLSALGAWLAGYFRMQSFEPAATAWAMLLFSLKAWVYGLAFLGMATGISQLFTSPHAASAVAFLALILSACVNGLALLGKASAWGRFGLLLDPLTPGGHRGALWHPDAAHLAPGLACLVALSVAYLLAGYAVFARRDL